MNEDGYISRQICVLKNTKVLIELLDKLNPAPLENYARIHANGEEDGSGWKRYSKIGIHIKDYTNGTGVNSVDVEANISPEEVTFLVSRVTAGFEEYNWRAQKIFGAPDQQGNSFVTVLNIKRVPRTAAGEVMNSPWAIMIENGVGVAAQRENGGTFCQKGTYQMIRSACVLLTDMDFFRLFHRAQQFILVWESIYGPHLYREGKAALAARLAANSASETSNAA